jgi:hypothetical protein
MSDSPTIFDPVSKMESCISKSKFIAEDVSLSSKEIGALIVKLQDSVDDLSIERWSYTGATTWRVEQTS